MKGWNYEINNDGTYYERKSELISIQSQQAGAFRQTKEQAKLAAKGMLRRNRLSALAEQLGDGEKEWVKDEDNFHIYKCDHEWHTSKAIASYYPERVYMDKETAKAVCDALNNGLFDLEGE